MLGTCPFLSKETKYIFITILQVRQNASSEIFLRKARFVVLEVNTMRLGHYWFIVCLIIAWIVSEGNSEKSESDLEPTKEACEEGSFVLNSCEEQCECKNGELATCYRVRKNFTKMTVEDRKRYINTYKQASVDPLFKKDYEKMVALHLNAPNKLLHHTPTIFFPWHRWFLVEFENLLRKIDCRVTIPYWDWSQVAHHWWEESSDDVVWASGDHGLGGNGNKDNDFCVETGPFRKDQWSVLGISGGGCLKRNFTRRSFTGDSEHVKKTLSLPLKDFFRFEKIVRDYYHAQPHDWIGATMKSPRSAGNSPEMPLHHSFLDKLWYQWQKKGDEYINVYYRSVPFKLPGSKYYGWEWMDYRNLPGQVNVIYEE